MLTAVANGPALTAAPAADTRPVCRLRRFNHWVDDIYYEGGWDVGPLRDSLTGHISTGGDRSACTFTFEGSGLILQFWSHGWSGLADIEVDGDRRTVDLFGESPALKNVHFDGLAPGVHLVRIGGVKRADAKHPGDQIVFHEAIVYDRVTETVPRQAGQTGRAQKPARFNAIYHAPGHLGWPERTVLYSTVFGARPGNVLIAGTRGPGRRGRRDGDVRRPRSEPGAGELAKGRPPHGPSAWHRDRRAGRGPYTQRRGVRFRVYRLHGNHRPRMERAAHVAKRRRAGPDTRCPQGLRTRTAGVGRRRLVGAGHSAALAPPGIGE